MATGPIRCGGQFGREEDGCRSVGTADNRYRSRLFGGKPQRQSAQEGEIDAHLGGGAEQHEFGPCQHGREIGHGAQPQEDDRWVKTGGHTEIEVVQDAVVFIDTKTETLKKRYVTNYYAKADG